MKRLLLVVCLMVTSARSARAATAGGEGPPVFTKGPTATRVGDKFRIAFAVSRQTDVAVFIQDAKDRIARHLVAGMLGKNPPPPLEPDSLSQSVDWDLKGDDGKPAGPGPFQARVAIGMRASQAGFAFADRDGPNNLTNVTGLAVGPTGQLYVLSERWRRGWWTATTVHLFRRDGKYVKTIKPFRADLPLERVKPIAGMTDADGRPLPTIYRVLAMSFYPNEDLPQQPAVTPEGNLHLAVTRAAYRKGPQKRLATIAPDGGVPYPEYTGGLLPSETSAGAVHLAPSSDGQAIYATGLERLPGDQYRPNTPAVYRIPLPDRSPAHLLLGDPEKTGKDAAHLNDPQGIAVDGKGHLLIADLGNDRVLVVGEGDGKAVGSIAVPSPTWVGSHRKTGAIYVRSGEAVIKFSGWKAPKELARLELPEMPAEERSRTRWSLALDPEAEPAVLWVGRNRGEPCLWRAEDRDATFGPLQEPDCYPARTYWNLSASLDRREISCKVGNYTLRILDEATGKWRDLRLTGSAGQTYRFGPDGQIYGMDHWKHGPRRWNRNGEPMPFPATIDDKELQGRLPNVPSGTTSWERDFCVDRQGNIYTKHRGKQYHGRMRIDAYDADGRFQRTVIWVVSDGALGPRLDAAGNLYIAEALKPPGTPYADFFKGKLPEVKIDWKGSVAQQYTWMYGSIVKFGPRGGAVWFPILDQRDVYPFDGEADLPADMPKEKIDTCQDDRSAIHPGELQGALWWRFGCSYVLDMQPGHNRRCHCTATEFDVDDFGRVFYPDQGRFRVSVLDSNGNVITHIGRYGNQDAAPPRIAIGWMVGLAVSDRHLYVADGLNRRVLRARLGCAAEAHCAVP